MMELLTTQGGSLKEPLMTFSVVTAAIYEAARIK
jgi:hypothetical protein